MENGEKRARRTGKRDKAGREIKEGDSVRLPDKTIRRITYLPEFLSFVFVDTFTLKFETMLDIVDRFGSYEVTDLLEIL